MQSTSVQVWSRISIAVRWAVLVEPGLAAQVEDLGPGAQDRGQEAGTAGQPSGLAGGDRVAGGGVGDAGGGEVGDQGVVVDQDGHGGGLAAVAGQVGLQHAFEQGHEPDAVLALLGELGELVTPRSPPTSGWWGWRRGAVNAWR